MEKSLVDAGDAQPSTSTQSGPTAAPTQPKPRKTTRKERKQKVVELRKGLTVANPASEMTSSFRREGFIVNTMNPSPHEKSASSGENTVKRVLWRQISPTVSSLPQDMVSGLCLQCYKLTAYSLTCFHDKDKTIAYCQTCSTPDNPVLLVMLFWLTMELDAQNSVDKVVIAGNDARYFFGCTETEYLSCEKTRARSQRDLRRVLGRKKNLTRVSCGFIPFTNPNFDSHFILSGCRLQTIADELALL